MPTQKNQPLDATKLLSARDKWTDQDWDSHFRKLGVQVAGSARYKTDGGNDILKYAISKVHGRKCWWGGSQDCESRALLLRNLQIDHIIPQTAEVKSLAEAVRTSEYQDNVFDVHDPGNLALICGPCNLEKGSKFKKEYNPKPHIEHRREIHEKKRGSVINAVRNWVAIDTIDDANLRLLLGTDLSNPVIRDMFFELSTEMVFKLADSLGQKFPVAFGEPVSVEIGDYEIEVRPSSESVEAYMVSLAEMEADARRAEDYFENQNL